MLTDAPAPTFTQMAFTSLKFATSQGAPLPVSDARSNATVAVVPGSCQPQLPSHQSQLRSWIAMLTEVPEAKVRRSYLNCVLPEMSSTSSATLSPNHPPPVAVTCKLAAPCVAKSVTRAVVPASVCQLAAAQPCASFSKEYSRIAPLGSGKILARSCATFDLRSQSNLVCR